MSEETIPFPSSCGKFVGICFKKDIDQHLPLE